VEARSPAVGDDAEDNNGGRKMGDFAVMESNEKWAGRLALFLARLTLDVTVD